MHYFATFLFFALGVMGLTALGERVTRQFREARVVLALGWGVGLAWLANFDMWSGWNIGNLRYDWVGVTLTGLALGGSALLVLALVGFFAGLYRKFDDQAEQIESEERDRRAHISKAA